GTPERDHTRSVVNSGRANAMVITLSAGALPDWLDAAHLGVAVMFDEGTYREMECALRTVMQAEDSRLAELRDILLGLKPARFSQRESTTAPALNESQLKAMNRVRSEEHTSELQSRENLVCRLLL